LDLSSALAVSEPDPELGVTHMTLT
jgi:hypothetical protein